MIKGSCSEKGSEITPKVAVTDHQWFFLLLKSKENDPQQQRTTDDKHCCYLTTSVCTTINMTNLIKNYLPLRLSLPSPINPSISEDTFLFVKQHMNISSSSGSSISSSQTLFIANAPFYPNIRTSILLQSIFERYGDVDRVVVAPNPRKNLGEQDSSGGDTTTSASSHQNTGTGADDDVTVSMFEKEINSIKGGDGAGAGTVASRQCEMALDESSWYDQGKFAHVIFSSPKMMKKVWGHLISNNSSGKKKKEKKKNSNVAIKFGKLEIQELEDISFGLFEKERTKLTKQSHSNSNDTIQGSSGEDSEGEEEYTKDQKRTRGLSNLVQMKKGSIPSRETLKMACDKIMAKYEAAEEEALQKQLAAKDQPDDDGFVTVSYGTNVGDIVELEENGTLGNTGAAGGRRRKAAMRRGRSRSSKTNVVKGSDELKDFYRFQLKESKKRSMEDLKSRFQEDLKRVKKMKEDKMYRPF